MHSEMEPALLTDPSLLGVLEELKEREPIFHRPELGTTRADFERMMAGDFWEIGASGQPYSRECVLDELERRHLNPREDVWETSGFHCRAVGSEVYLLTYTLIQNKIRKSRRLTVWQRTEVGWKILFHQGTIVQDGSQDE
jgi:hypothetical protein